MRIRLHPASERSSRMNEVLAKIRYQPTAPSSGSRCPGVRRGTSSALSLYWTGSGNCSENARPVGWGRSDLRGRGAMSLAPRSGAIRIDVRRRRGGPEGLTRRAVAEEVAHAAADGHVFGGPPGVARRHEPELRHRGGGPDPRRGGALSARATSTCCRPPRAWRSSTGSTACSNWPAPSPGRSCRTWSRGSSCSRI